MRAIELLDASGAHYRLEEHNPTYTAQRLAHEVHMKGCNVLKPVVVHSGKKKIMCVIPADHHLNLDAVSSLLGLPEPVTLVEESQFSDIFYDADVGAECPIGELYGMETVMDESLHHAQHDVLFQCGSHRNAVRMQVTEFVRVVCPTIGEISHHL